MEEFDVIVVGAGPGGYLTAIRLAKLGAKVLVFDRDRVGGECLNYACIPSKALINYLSSLEYVCNVLGRDSLDIDWDGLRSHRDSVVESLVKGVTHIFKRLGIVYRNEEVVSIAEHKVYIRGGDVYRAENVVLATGSRPRVLPNIPFNNYVWSSRDALKLPRKIRSLCIVGGGAAGLEIASIYNLLGAEVHIVEVMDRLAPFMDHDIGRRLRSLFSRRGIKTYLSSRVDRVEFVDGRANIYILSNDGSCSRLVCDAIVVAIGRDPYLDITGDIEELERDEAGYVIVNESMGTNIEYIYAVGDVAGPPLLAHKAYWDALTVSDYLYGSGEISRPSNIPYVIYSTPGAFSIGLSEAEARVEGIDFETYVFPLSALGSSALYGGDPGFLKIICGIDGRVLGIHGVSKKITELVGIASIITQLGLKIDELADIIFPHPTYSEAYWELFNQAFGRDLHKI